MRTTLGRNALAAAAKAVDSERAASGISVLGVTGAPPGPGGDAGAAVARVIPLPATKPASGKVAAKVITKTVRMDLRKCT